MLGAGLLLFALLTHAAWGATSQSIGGQTADFTLFDPIDADSQRIAGGWLLTIQGLVTNTFRILAVIEICWAAAIWAFEKDSLNSLAVEIIKKIMFIGFFFTLLTYAPTWIPTIVAAFRPRANRPQEPPPISRRIRSLPMAWRSSNSSGQRRLMGSSTYWDTWGRSWWLALQASAFS